jgi:hypothetical protein
MGLLAGRSQPQRVLGVNDNERVEGRSNRKLNTEETEVLLSEAFGDGCAMSWRAKNGEAIAGTR